MGAVCANLFLTDTAAILNLGFELVPLAVDTLAAPTKWVVTTVQYYARQVSMRFVSMTTTAAIRIWQEMSFLVWSSVAAAILARMLVQADTRLLYFDSFQ